MTNYSELTQAWQALSGLAPALFIPITDDESLKAATRALENLDDEMSQSALNPHPLTDLAQTVMHRIMSYEESLWPTASPDMELRLLMSERELTQQQLSAATGISQSVISRLSLGKRSFTAEQAKILGLFFGVNPSIFL